MYQAPDKKIWKGRMDLQDRMHSLRWHQLITPLNLAQNVHLSGQQNNIAFLGFCCDEGVRRNKGRLGAQQGPDTIRQAMVDLPVHFNTDHTAIFDAGNVICPGRNLETAQELLGQKTLHLLQHGFIPVLLGGGHEISYGHYLGLHQHLKAHPEANFGILNIDSHFNLSSYSKDPNNETAFRQIADLRRNHDKDFNYFCVGIQQKSNSLASYNYAKNYNTQFVSVEDVRESRMPEVKQLINTWLEDKDWIYLSLDLDAVSTNYAPGVSTPTALGLDPFVVEEIIKQVICSGKILSIDIAELCPTHDPNSSTSKLAASFIFEIVQAISSVK